MNIAHSPHDDKAHLVQDLSLADMAHKLQQFVEDAAHQGDDFHVIEKGVLDFVLRMGKIAINQALQLQGNGDLGPSLQTDDGQTLVRSETPKDRSLRSIFGEHCFSAYVYSRGAKKAIALRPIDARLNLPEGKGSYLFEEFSQYFCVEQAFGQSSEALEMVLGQKISVDTLEQTNQRLGEQAEQFLHDLPDVPCEEEGELLIATADGKGVPLIHGEVDKSPVHGPKPPRPHNRRMATVACVYSVDPHHRDAEEVVAALFRDERSEEERKKRRPKPCHKRMTACFSTVADEGTSNELKVRGDIEAWTWANEQVTKRRAEGQTLVRLCDGQQSLWDTSDICLGLNLHESAVEQDALSADDRSAAGLTRETSSTDGGVDLGCVDASCEATPFASDACSPVNSVEAMNDEFTNASEKRKDKVVDILDIIHVCGYVWLAAGAFYEKKSAAAEAFARDRILRILQGGVKGVISGMRRMATQQKLSDERQKKIHQACNYFAANQDRMKYDQYLLEGYPIASGVIEGACRHLVKDRMERTGMRWREANAGAMLFVRALKVTDLWDDFQHYRQEKERERLHPHRRFVAGYAPAVALAA